MDAHKLLCPWKRRRAEKLRSSQHHGQPMVDATVRG